MKNIKDITLLAFAVIGLYTIITAFQTTKSIQTQKEKVINGAPESHVWEFIVGNQINDYFLLNKTTGELRKVSGYDLVEKACSKTMIF